MSTSFNVDKTWGIGVLRKKKAIRVNNISLDSHASALEHLVIGVPYLNDAAFGLDAVGGFEGIEPVEAAVAVPALALAEAPVGVGVLVGC